MSELVSDESLSALLAQGDAALKEGACERARALYEQALALAASLENDKSRGAIYQRLGRAYAVCGQWDKAAANYEEAAALAHQMGSGFARHEMDAYHQASRAYLNLALANPAGEAQQAAHQKAGSAARKLLALARSVGSGLDECKAWASLGSAQRGLGEYTAAVESVGYAFAIAHEAKAVVAAADYLIDLGNTELLAGHPQEAARHYQRGLTLLRPPKEHPASAARLHDGLAEVHLARKRFALARLHAEQAVGLAQQAHHPYLEARHHSTLGQALAGLGEYEQAIPEHQAAIDLLQTIRGRRAVLDLAGEWGNLSDCHRVLGQHQLALEALGKALRLAHDAEDPLGEAKWRDTLGVVYEELGDLESAATCHREALPILEQLGRDCEATIAHNNLGTTLYRRALLDDDEDIQLQRFAEAEAHLRQAQERAQWTKDEVMAANAAGNLGLVFLRTGRTAAAVQAFKEAHAALQVAGHGLEAGHQLENLGLAHAEYLHDTEQALDYYDKTLQAARAYGDADGLRIALTRLGDMYRTQLDDPLIARRLYTEAVDLIESGALGRATLSLPAHRAGLLARNLAAYEGLIQLHWRADEFAAAFDWAERARARAFLEQIGLFAPLPIAGLPEKWLTQERELIRQARARDHSLLHTQDQIERIRLVTERRDIQDALNDLWKTMGDTEAGIRYADLRRGTPATAPSLQAWLDARPDDTALVAYYSLPEAICAWVFRARRPLQAVRIPIDQAALRRYVRIFGGEVPALARYPQPPKRQTQMWAEKTAPLVTMLHPHLEDARTLYLVPHGRLHDLPLHALSVDDRPLGEAFAVVYAPSVGVLLRHTLAASGPRRDPLRALAFGFTSNTSEVQVFAQATQQAAAILGTLPYRDDTTATRGRFLEQAPTAELIYLLCHGEFDARNPLDSRLLLADNPLTVRDILSLRLPGTLVILTACQSGMSQVNPGDELVGLSQAFLMAGASAVLAARWTVEATSAIKLVEEFYVRWRDRGASPAAALQQAMQAVRQQHRPGDHVSYHHPFYWAPFMLVGNAD